MINITIDTIPIQIPEGTTILQAAEQAGIHIPTMCHSKSIKNHASCMVCGVLVSGTTEMIPSCETKATEGMVVQNNTEEVIQFRKEALELLLSDHVGDCEAPCRISCPVFPNIPAINRLIASGNSKEAVRLIREEMALPLILGHLCHAPCENACRRNQVDEPIAICQLIKFTILENATKEDVVVQLNKEKNRKVVIIGSGPAGLSSAYFLAKKGYGCTLVEAHNKFGGTLLSVPKEEMPSDLMTMELVALQKMGIVFQASYCVTPEMIHSKFTEDFDAVVIASGESKIFSEFGDHSYENRGIFLCGSVIKPIKKVVRAISTGKDIAFNVDSYLQGEKQNSGANHFNSQFGRLLPSEVEYYLAEAIPDNRTTPERGKIAGFTTDEAIREAKRCIRCDCRKSNSCKLRITSHQYGADQRKYKLGDRMPVRRFFHTHKMVYEPEKCIKCGLCIKVAEANNENIGLSFMHRGFEMKVGIPYGESLQQAIVNCADQCIEACPTGALASFSGEN